MIGRISGEIVLLKPPYALVEAWGIAYEIDLPMSDCAELPNIGSQVVLYTHMVIREDAHSLFGFITLESRDCFRQLLKVSGIGPRIALALLSTLNVDELNVAINNADIAILCRTPGIGKKVAERLVLELKGKFLGGARENAPLALIDNYSIHSDISYALNSLGYGDKEISQVLKQLPKEQIDLSTGIKEALKLLNKHK